MALSRLWGHQTSFDRKVNLGEVGAQSGGEI